MTMKTRARVSFVVDLDKINDQRKLLGKAPLTEHQFFEAISDKDAAVMMACDKGVITVSASLGYIVI